MKVTCLSMKIKNWVIIALSLLLASCLSGGGGGSDAGTGGSPTTPTAGTCSTITHLATTFGGVADPGSNVVFTFDKAYACGQFANGDWWVSVDAGGRVRITSITPDAAGGKNGFQVNPSTTTTQAFDVQAAEVTYNAALMPSLPYDASGGESIVKAVSFPADVPIQLKFAAVLTVVNSPLTNSNALFRPAYFGTTKVFYSVNDLRLNLITRTIAASSLASAGALTIADVANRFRNVQLDHIFGASGRVMHPVNNMEDYGAAIARDNGAYLGRLLLTDFDFSNPIHKLAMVNYVQMGIDLQAMAAGGLSWPGNGGHGNGRKLPIVFAGWLLNSVAFSSVITALPTKFSEDTEVYRSAVTGRVLWGSSATDSDYWGTTVTTNNGLAKSPGNGTGNRHARDPYQLIDGGGYEIGDGYQLCCTSMPWKYSALAVRMLSIQPEWNNDLLLEYVDRWVNSGTIAAPDSCAPYDGLGWTYPPGPPPPPNDPAWVFNGAVALTNYGVPGGWGPAGGGACQPGAGRWVGMHGVNVNTGGYGNAFGNALWRCYVDGVCV